MLAPFRINPGQSASTMREQMNVRVDASTKRGLEGLATAQGISLKRLIEQTCEEVLAAHISASEQPRRIPDPEPVRTVEQEADKNAPVGTAPESRSRHTRAFMVGGGFCTKCDRRVPEDHWR